MFRRSWQQMMIALARSSTITNFMQNTRATTRLARRYVAGKDADNGLSRAQELMAVHGIRASLFYLGEYVDDQAGIEENVAAKHAIAESLKGSGLDLHISLDPTQIGHQIDPELSARNAADIARHIKTAMGNAPGLHCLMLDMEDASLNDPTIALHDQLAAQGLPVALTLQAYLRRTEADLRAQIERGGTVRLVKGAFAAGADIAFQSQSEIKANSRKLIALMLSAEAKERGFYPIIATHDTRLQDFARQQAAANGWQPGEYEFEMLLGVRQDVAEGLVESGERVRLYVPFGRDWWPYAVRRIGENPRNAILLGRSLVGV